MFLVELINENKYKGKDTFMTPKDLMNGIAYCFDPGKTEYRNPVTNIRNHLAGCSTVMLPEKERTDPKKVIGAMLINNQVFGRSYRNLIKHRIISFDSDEVIDPAAVYRLGQMICDWYFSKGYLAAFGVHLNTENIHVHIMINTVSFLNGNRFSISYELKNLFSLIGQFYWSECAKMLSNPACLLSAVLTRFGKCNPELEEKAMQTVNSNYAKATIFIRPYVTWQGK